MPNIIEAIAELLKRFFGTGEAEPENSASSPTIVDTLVAVEESLDYILEHLEHHGVKVSEASEDLKNVITKFSDLESQGFDKNVIVSVLATATFMAIGMIHTSINPKVEKEAGELLVSPASNTSGVAQSTESGGVNPQPPTTN